MSDLLKKSEKIIDLGCISGKHLLYHRESECDIILGKMEYEYLNMLDGSNGEKEILESMPFLNNKLADLNSLLCEKGLIFGYEKKKERSLSNIVLFSYEFKNQKIISDKIKIVIKVLFYLAFAFGVGVVLLVPNALNYGDTLGKFRLFDYIYALIIICLSIYLHELGHVYMAKTYNAYVPQFNFGFIMFIPCVSTVISGLSTIKRKSERIKICLSGIAVNLWLFSLATIINYYFNITAIEFVSLFNLTVALFNLIIFVRTDGWQILNLLAKPCIDKKNKSSLLDLQDKKNSNIFLDSIRKINMKDFNTTIIVLRIFVGFAIFYILK